MELELERKLMVLENSVKDIDERLAELYRETASLSLQKSSFLQDLGRSAVASKRRADDVKRIHSELKTGLGDVSEKLARMDSVITQLDSMRRSARREKSKEFAELAGSVLALNKRVSLLGRAVDGSKGGLNGQRVDGLEKTVEDVRSRTNAVLKEIYDMMDGLNAAQSALDRKVSALPALSAEGDVDVSGILFSIDELRGNVSTLSKGIEISRVIAEEVKKTQVGLSAVESWKSRTEELPRELERLAERMAALESSKGANATKDGTDLNNLKLAVAELANKNRLINDLALENQKLQGRLFVLEERLGPSERKEDGKDN